MARKQPEIQVKAYVNIDGREVDIDTLSEEKRKEIGTALSITYFNAMFAGKAVFYAKGKEQAG